MNRLWVRLTLAFMAVILVTLLIIELFASNSAGNEFQQYLVRRDALAQTGLLEDLMDYYQQHQSWQGVASVLAAQGPGLGRGQQGGAMRGGRAAILLADKNGQIAYDGRGERLGTALSSAERASALPIQDGGVTIGYFVFLPGRGAGMQPAEQNFLGELQQTLLIAALLAGGVGICLGFVISTNQQRLIADLMRDPNAMRVRSR